MKKEIKKDDGSLVLTLINLGIFLCVMAIALWINPGNTDRYIKETAIEAKKMKKIIEEKNIDVENIVKKHEEVIKKYEDTLKKHAHEGLEGREVILYDKVGR